jgi:hypothetical protein
MLPFKCQQIVKNQIQVLERARIYFDIEKELGCKLMEGRKKI